MDESELLRTFRSQTPGAALEQLFETYADRIYRLSLSLLGDEAEAEDVVQQTFLSAITNRSRFEGRSSLGSWLYRIAYNAGYDRLRRRVDDPLPEEDSVDEEDGNVAMPQVLVEWRWNPETILGDREVRGHIQAAVYALPEKLRAVFHLRDVEDLSIEETAAILGITTSAVKVRLHRARLMLRESLSAYFADRNERRS